MKSKVRGLVWLAAVGVLVAGVAWAQRKPPCYASIAAKEARMRTGPGHNYPAIWLYRRADLPIKVIASYADRGQSWRKIEDPDGAQGWMQASLLSDRRTAMVVGAVAELHSRPDQSTGIDWRAAPGVVGRISKCAEGWCWFNVQGKGGYVEQSHLWGVEPGEVLP